MYLRPISVLPSNTHQSSKASLSLRFTPQNHLYSAHLLQTCYMPHPFSISLLWSPKHYTLARSTVMKPVWELCRREKSFTSHRNQALAHLACRLAPWFQYSCITSYCILPFSSVSLGSLELFPLILLSPNHLVSCTVLLSHFIWQVSQLYTVYFPGQSKVLL
jgi:hypothetical protein